jgi:hypothetical protein
MGLGGEASPDMWGSLHNYSGLPGVIAIQATRLILAG